MIQGWAYISAGIESDGSLAVKRAKTCKGYIAQEIDRLMQKVREHYGG